MNPCLLPYIGIDDIKFGMTTEQIIEICGAPSVSTKTRRGANKYLYDDKMMYFSKESDVLQEIMFYPSSQVYLDNIDIFGDNSALNKMIEAYGVPKESFGTLVFISCGMALSGFHDNSDDGKTITAFCKGLWDTDIVTMKDFIITNK